MSRDEKWPLAFHRRVHLLLCAAVVTVIANSQGIGWFPVFPEGLLRVLPERHLWNLYVFGLIGDEAYSSFLAGAFTLLSSPYCFV